MVYISFRWKKAEEKISAAELEKERIITEQQLSLTKARENEVAWKKALREFERYRITSGHSLESVFNALNQRGSDRIPVKDFAENVSRNYSMPYKTALTVANTFDISNRSEISLMDMKKTISKQKSLTSISGLLENHSLFPSWLTSRLDFQHYFREWAVEDGAPDAFLVENALFTQPRKAGDLQLIFKWIKMHKILVHVKDSRMLDVCKSIQLITVPEGVHVVTQGDDGDAFYIVLDGTLNVFVNNTCVGSMFSGMSFGEKALENNAPRAATVTSTSKCKLMVLRASEYKSLIATAQHQQNSEIVEFLHTRCKLFKDVSYARLFYMVKLMNRRCCQPNERIMKQGEEAGCLYVVMRGQVKLSRWVSGNPSGDNSIVNGSVEYNSIGDNQTKRVDHVPFQSLQTINQEEGSVDSDEEEDSTAQDEDSVSVSMASLNSPQQNRKISDLRRQSQLRYKETLRKASIMDVHAYRLYQAAKRQVGGITVPIMNVQAGAVFGEDCLRYTNMASYGAVATVPTEVIIINKKELSEYFEDKLMDRRLLYKVTRPYHLNDFQLVKQHSASVSKQLKLNELKLVAMGQQYQKRVYFANGDESVNVDSRGMSNTTLEYKRARRASVAAHCKYAQLAIKALEKPKDKPQQRRRRSSGLVSFLKDNKLLGTPQEKKAPAVAAEQQEVSHRFQTFGVGKGRKLAERGPSVLFSSPPLLQSSSAPSILPSTRVSSNRSRKSYDNSTYSNTSVPPISDGSTGTNVKRRTRRASLVNFLEPSVIAAMNMSTIEEDGNDE